jgi:AcrR family transcriptional regulator
MSQPSARDRILETAGRLFLQEGYRATGIDRIIAESGVAKMSLYRNFKSKNELIAAFLEWRDAAWMQEFVEKVESRFARHASLTVLADALGECFAQEDFRGCAFINVVAEAGSEGDPVHRQLAVAHKQALERFVATLAERLGLRAPAMVAAEAMLCIEGMMVRYQMLRDAAVVNFGQRVLATIEADAVPAKRKAVARSGAAD